MKYFVNVDCGVDVAGAHFDLGATCELDSKDETVIELVETGRLVPVTDEAKAAKTPDKWLE